MCVNNLPKVVSVARVKTTETMLYLARNRCRKFIARNRCSLSIFAFGVGSVSEKTTSRKPKLFSR